MPLLIQDETYLALVIAIEEDHIDNAGRETGRDDAAPNQAGLKEQDRPEHLKDNE